MALADRLKELRKREKITQRQLAENTGIPFQSIVNYENGRREPNNKAMVALEKYFNVTGSYLRGETDDPEYPYWDMPGAAELLKENYAFLFQQLSENTGTASEEIRQCIADALTQINNILRSDNEGYKLQGALLMRSCCVNAGNFMANCRVADRTSTDSTRERGFALAMISDAFKDAGDYFYPHSVSGARTYSEKDGFDRERIEYFSK